MSFQVMKIYKWYFAINETGIPGYERLIRSAVMSCRMNTSLQPVCIYFGSDVPLLEWLVSQDVKVIRHKSSLLDVIQATPSTERWDQATATGAYLRIDIPLLEHDDEYVLYTDCDVVFTADIHDFGSSPKYFSAAPEYGIEDWRFVNTGAMVINVPNMRDVHQDFSNFAGKHLTQFAYQRMGTYDQGALNAYFAGKWDRLPVALNWKPYWGVSPQARIVHFHGPKPPHLERILAGDGDKVPKVYNTLCKKNPEAMAYYLGRFHAIEALATGRGDQSYRGCVERLRKENDHYVVVGWCVDSAGFPAPTFEVRSDAQDIAVVRVDRVEREDVSRSIDGAAKDAGYELRVRAPHGLQVADFEVYPQNSRRPLVVSQRFRHQD